MNMSKIDGARAIATKDMEMLCDSGIFEAKNATSIRITSDSSVEVEHESGSFEVSFNREFLFFKAGDSYVFDKVVEMCDLFRNGLTSFYSSTHGIAPLSLLSAISFLGFDVVEKKEENL